MTSPVAGVAEVHEMARDGDVMRMRAVPALALPADKEAHVFDAPDLSADTMRWNSMEGYYLIGVSGEFYIIMNSEEAIGYIPQDWLWAGNG